MKISDENSKLTMHAKRDRYEQLLKDQIFMSLNPRLS